MDRKPTSYSAYPSETVTRPDGSTLTTYSTHAFGLFVENSGIIEDLNVSIEYKIEANPYAVSGSICGINSGLISNCKTYGTIFAEKTSNSGDSCFGGIAGLIDNGKITLCANNVDISGKNPYSFPYINCGGIVGGSNGKGKNVISYCYNNGNITPETVSDGYLAGIAARASGFGTYYNGYSFVIENCYNTGTIGNENIYGKVAGICGEGYHKETKLINCYNVGSIKSSNKSAGIIIEYNRSTNCYYLNSSADCLWYSYGTNYIINDLYDSQMKTEEAFNGFDFNNVWIVDASSEYPYPQLKNNLQSEKIPVEHDYSEIILVDATCTKLGLKKLFCSKCGFAFDVVIDKSATHIYTSEVTTVPTHLAEGIKTFTCACGDTYTEAIAKLTAHTYEEVVTEPTCTAKGYTTYTCACGDSYVDNYTDELDHEYTSEVTTEPTHLTEGIETFTCKCGDTYTEPVAKLEGHTYTSEVTKEATHLAEGETTYTCACGDSYVADYTRLVITEGLEYKLLLDNSGYVLFSIYGFEGDMLIIPETIEGIEGCGVLPVVEIRHNTFENYTSIKTVVIPETVELIGISAFEGCEGLELIIYRGTMAQWEEIVKLQNWDLGTGNYTIRCTDGDIVK